MAERYKFHQRTQKDSEGVTAFAAELRRLASTCNFGEFLAEALRDQLVCGIKNNNTQRKLLSEDRSFDQAMQMALADEVSLSVYVRKLNVVIFFAIILQNTFKIS